MKKVIIIAQVIVLFFAVPVSAQLVKMQRQTNGAVRVNTMSFVTEGVYFIKVNETGKYFGIEGVNPNNGARLVQWDFANQDNHKFQIIKSADGYYFIKAMFSNRYLNVGGQSQEDGAIIIQWDFAEQDNLKWSFSFDGTTRTYVIRNKQSGKELKLQGSNVNNGNGAILAINGNAGKQTFVLQPANEIKNAPTAANPNKIQQVNTFKNITT